LITQHRLGRQIIYAAEYAAMNALLAYLSENCCGQDASRAPACSPTAAGAAATEEDAA
jgi:hypothetical protein